MYDSASMILDKICLQIFKGCALAYFITDDLGKIVQHGGNFYDLNMHTPEKDSNISDAIIFMEGLLPLESESMEFSCIKMPSGACVDALLFKINKGYGLIIWNAAKKNALLTQTQQQYNALSLLIEKQKNRLISLSDEKPAGKNNIILEELFQKLNLAVFKMDDKGRFVFTGKPPLWLEEMPQFIRICLEQADENGDDKFSFLVNFINEAKFRWAKNEVERFNSGIWAEKDNRGREVLFEANAIDINGEKILVISRDICHPHEKQVIIQKGREMAIDYHNLERSSQQLKLMHDELELRVKERTRDLEMANKKLADELEERKKIEKENEEVSRQLRQSQKMEAIGTLAGGIAHDFNNILSGIMGFTELSILDAGDDLKLKQKLTNILHASDRARELIRQIMAFSHSDEYEKNPLKLRLVVTEALNLLRASLPSNIDIKKNLKSDGYILADLTQIHQIMMNLCTNAWHAMGKENGTLTVSLDERDVKTGDLTAAYESISGKYLVLTVKDTGCGMQPDLIEKIFDPYFTTKEKGKGTGLGLSVVHGIVKSCHGCITVDSQLGKGSVFKVYFPAFEKQNTIKTIDQPMPLGSNETILFIDDDTFQIEMADLMLSKLGYRAVTCNDSIKALDIFLEDKNKFDLIITDMIMPKMSGTVLAERILKIKPDIPIILCSGCIDDFNPDTIKEIGIKKYLMKPFVIRDLANALDHALTNCHKADLVFGRELPHNET